MTADPGRDLLDAEEAFLRLANTVVPLEGGAELVTNPLLPSLAEANQVRRVRARDEASADRLVDEAERHFRGLGASARRWVLDPGATPPRMGDLLASRGYARYEEEGLVLAGAPAGKLPPSVRLREIREDADWDRLDDLDVSSGERRLNLDTWERMAQIRRKKCAAGPFRYWMVEKGEEPIGVVGLHRAPALAVIQDYFIRPEWRDRGIGRGVLGRLASDLGKTPVLGVVCPAGETESDFYTHLGFQSVIELKAYEKD